jgi:hypothetical protein
MTDVRVHSFPDNQAGPVSCASTPGSRPAPALFGDCPAWLSSFHAPDDAGGPGGCFQSFPAVPVRPSFFLGSPFMSWRCSFVDALKPVEQPVLNNGPYAIHRGEPAATCVHESGHALAHVCAGGSIDHIEVELRFMRIWGGVVAAGACGQCTPKGATVNVYGLLAAEIPLIRTIGPPPSSECWRHDLERSIFQYAGPAAEAKYRAQDGLVRMPIRGPDAEIVERAARLVWLAKNRDGHAFQRLVWKLACDLMDDPAVWKAVSAVEGELFSGLLRLEPSDPRPGDSVKYTMTGDRAEQLIVEAGVRPIDILAGHRCGPECVKPSRRTSRRWQGYLAEWATESKDAA